MFLEFLLSQFDARALAASDSSPCVGAEFDVAAASTGYSTLIEFVAELHDRPCCAA